MGLPSSRFMIFHRLVLLPPLVLLTLTCLYTSSTLSSFSSTRRLSFSQDVQCFSCESSPSFSSPNALLSLANFPASSYIRDIVLPHNVLNVEDSRGETSTEPQGSRHDTNEPVESFDYGQKSREKTAPGDEAVDAPHRDTTRTVQEEDASLNPEEEEDEASASLIVVLHQASVAENSVNQESKAEEKEEEKEEVPAQVSEEPTDRSIPSDEKPAEEKKVSDGSIYGDNVSPTEEKIDIFALSAENKVDNSVPSDITVVESSGPGDENVDSSVQVVEISSETNLEASRKEDHADSSVPDSGENVHSSDEAEEFSSETNLGANRNEDHVDSSVPDSGENAQSSDEAEGFSSEMNLGASRNEDHVDSSVPDSGENAHSSDEAEGFSSEPKERLEDSRTEDVSASSDPDLDKSVDTSIQAEELYSGTKDNSESNRKEDDHGSIPEDVGTSSLKVVESQGTETNENLEGDHRKEGFQLENRHLTSEDHHARPDEHVEVTPTETNVSVTAEESTVPGPPPPAKIEVMRFWYANMSKEAEKAGIALQNLVDTITKSGLPTESVNSLNAEDLDVNLLLRGGSPQGVPLREEKPTCEGRRIFVYDLPSKFNVDLVGQCDSLLHWLNFCEYFKNGGMGTNVPTDELNDRGEKVLVPDGSWFLTHQYALELIFHARLKHYPCLTTDVNRADLFFVPYYAGLDVIRWHFKPNITNDQRDELTVELMDWLEGQESWTRNNGIDHVFVLGKISWDFRRSSRNTTHWGSKLLVLPDMARPTKLLIERDPWHSNDIGVPHPTFFHPKDDNEIRTWLAHVEQSERRYLVSFAGMPRPNMKTNVRGHLIQQCLDNPDDCFLLRCVRTLCMRPDSTMNLFLHSHFCMQPPGDSPTRRSVFDSLIGGCIPVLFDPYTAYYQYPWHLPRNASSYSVFIPSSDVMSGTSDIVQILKSITPEERTEMRTRIIREIIPGLLYSQPGTKHSDFRDSFDISIEALLNRVANMRARQKSIM